jgi:hypothetical protein
MPRMDFQQLYKLASKLMLLRTKYHHIDSFYDGGNLMVKIPAGRTTTTKG